MSLKNWVHGLIAVIIATARAEEIQNAVAGFDPQSALTALYGGKTWKDPKLAQYFRSVNDGPATDLKPGPPCGGPGS
jgi:hypothetical protein